MKNLHFPFIIFFLFFISCSTSKKATQSFDSGEYSTSIFQYQKGLKTDDPESNFLLAEAYRKSNQLKEAEPYYLAAITAGIQDETSYFYYALALKSNGKIEKAKKILDDYLVKGHTTEVINMARRELDNLNSLENITTNINYFKVKNLEAINTEFAEYSPFYHKGQLYFTSNRSGGKIYKGTGTPFTDIYRVETKGAKVDLSTLEELSPVINEPNVNIGSMTISKNGRTLIFAKANSGKASGTAEVNLYFTRYRNGTWLKPRPLNINGVKTWDSTPALDTEGTTLYFSSNRKGGLGGLDLYTASLNRRGRWVDLRNMGEHINTVNNEMFPYAAATGDFYFSSDGWAGFGGLDIFKASREKGHTQVENLGKPINSSSDDFGIFLFNPSRGFFSSNRKEGKGDDDIYTFINNDPNLKIVNYWLSGTTLTEDENKQMKPLPNTKVVLVSNSGEIIHEIFTQVDGKYKFRVFSEEEYYLIAEKEDYFTTRIGFSTIGKSADKTKLTKMVNEVNFKLDLPLDKIIIGKTIVLNNIYYDLNKADIKPTAAKELDKLVILMLDNSTINIELSSHTDTRATHEYNMNLSQRRAQAVVNYIVAHGIVARRMIAKGYGETQLIIAEAKNEEEHQINRRTEFKVTKYQAKSARELLDDERDETDRFFDAEDESP